MHCLRYSQFRGNSLCTVWGLLVTETHSCQRTSTSVLQLISIALPFKRKGVSGVRGQKLLAIPVPTNSSHVCQDRKDFCEVLNSNWHRKLMYSIKVYSTKGPDSPSSRRESRYTNSHTVHFLYLIMGESLQKNGLASADTWWRALWIEHLKADYLLAATN